MVPVLPCGSHSALPQVFLSRSFCLTSRMVRRQSSIPRRLCQDFNCRSRCDSLPILGKQPITQRSGGALQNGTYLVLSLVNCREPSEWCPDRKRSLPTCRRSLAGCAAQILLASVPRSSAYSEGSLADGSAHLPCAKDPVCASRAPVELVEKRRPGVLPHTDRIPNLPTLHRWLAAHHLASSGPNREDASRGTVELQLYDRVHCVALGRRHPHPMPVSDCLTAALPPVSTLWRTMRRGIAGRATVSAGQRRMCR